MKRIACFLLSLFLCLSAVSAFAAGKLSVTKENFHYVTSFWNYGYAYAKVENVGDKPIKVNAGVLEIYDANGEALTSTDYVQAYATYLQPGEYTYVEMYDELEDGQIPDDYMLTLTGKSENEKVAYRLPAEAKFELDVKEDWWEYNYLYATVTNPTEDILYNVEVVFALMDAESNIIYIESKELYSEIGIMPGQSVLIRKEISSTFTDYFDSKGVVPSSVDVLAYVVLDKE